MTESIVDLDTSPAFNISAANLTFAITEIDPRIARVEVVITKRTKEGKEKIPVKMVECLELFEQKAAEGKPLPEEWVKHQGFTNGGFMCPDTTDLVVKGEFHSEEFYYVSIGIFGCTLSEEECEPREKVNGVYVTLTLLNSFIALHETNVDQVIKQGVTSDNLAVLDTTYA